MGDEKFNAWMKKIDGILIAKCGMTALDLPDIAYRDFFDDEMSPQEVAQIALEEAGGGDLW